MQEHVISLFLIFSFVCLKVPNLFFMSVVFFLLLLFRLSYYFIFFWEYWEWSFS